MMTQGRRMIGRMAGTALVAGALWLGGCQVPNNVLRQQGHHALQRRDIDTAEERFAIAVNQDPADWRAMWHLGRIYLERGRPLDAQLLLERAYSLRDHHNDTPDILDDLAESLYQQDRERPLIALVRQRAQQYGTPRDHIRHGRYLYLTGDPDSAQIAFRKALQLSDENDPAPYLAMADFYEAIGDRTRTIQSLRVAYGLTPREYKYTLDDRLREYHLVPGPSISLPPYREIELP